MKIKHTGVAVGLLLLLIFVYWPGIVGNTAMKWDATAIYLPWKLFLTRTVFSGNLPLWNPFTIGGFPQCMDPGTWYPISYIFGWGGVYDLQRLLYEYLFHVWICGIGLYAILVNFRVDWRIAGVLSALFLFNGFFVGNAQHIGWIVAATWSIWSIFWFQLLWDRIANLGSGNSVMRWNNPILWLPILGLSLSMFLLFTGGYPGMFVIQCYVLAFWSVWKWFSNKKQFREGVWAQIRFVNLFAMVVFGLVALPAIVSLFTYLPWVTRSSGLNDSALMFGSFPAICALDWFIPLTWLDLGEVGRNLGDISMINGFWSRLGMWLILALMFFKTSRNAMLPYWVVGLSFWLLSMGNDLPFKNWLNQWAVGMDYFRFPAQFRFWGILFWMIALGRGAMFFPLPTRLQPISLRALLVIILLAEGVWHGFDQRYKTVFSGKDEFVDASVVKSNNASLSFPVLRFPRNIDTVSLRKLDGSAFEPLGNLWYNRGILLAVMAADGYNPYSFKTSAPQFRDTAEITNVPNSDAFRGIMQVSSSLWRISDQVLLNNNSMACTLEFVGNSARIGSAKNDYLFVRQLSVPGWKCRFSDGSKSTDISLSIDGIEKPSDYIRIPLEDLLTLNATNHNVSGKEVSRKKFSISLEFSPAISVAGFSISLVTIAIFSWLFLGVFCVTFCVFLYKEYFKQ